MPVYLWGMMSPSQGHPFHPDRLAAFRGFLRRRLPDAATAEDILQENLLKALQQDAWSEKENPSAWFHRVLRNAVTDFYRARAAKNRRETAFVAELGETDPGHDVPEEEACTCFRASLPELKQEYAEILRIVDLDGIPQADAAVRLGLSGNNLSVRLHRARKALRARLLESCGACAKHGCLDCSCRHEKNTIL